MEPPADPDAAVPAIDAAALMDPESIRSDFDRLARLSDGDYGTPRYDPFLLAAIPGGARRVLDVGCGTGRLTVAAATGDRLVVGIDLSPAMIERASRAAGARRVRFQCGDFLDLELEPASFDCVISAATLHHMPADLALARMSALLRPGGRLIVHDLLRNTDIGQDFCAGVAFLHESCRRFIHTGRLRPSRAAREAWKQHGATEVYLTRQQVRSMVDRLLPGALIHHHWLWRYTILWDR